MAHHDRTIFAGWIRRVGHNLGQRIPEYRRRLVKGYAVLLKVASRFGLVPLEPQFGHDAASVLLQLAKSGHFWAGLTQRSAASRPSNEDACANAHATGLRAACQLHLVVGRHSLAPDL